MRRLLLSLVLIVAPVAAAAPEVALVVHPAAVVRQITADELRDIFLGRKRRWDNGQAIRLVLPPSTPASAKWIEELTALGPTQFGQHWKKLVFTGQGLSPLSFATEAEVVAFVARTPGALGLVSPATPRTAALTLVLKPAP